MANGIYCHGKVSHLLLRVGITILVATNKVSQPVVISQVAQSCK